MLSGFPKTTGNVSERDLNISLVMAWICFSCNCWLSSVLAIAFRASDRQAEIVAASVQVSVISDA